MTLTYDRRAPSALLDALDPAGGWARSLVEYGRSGQYALDLQLRGYEGKNTHWATLYVGLTKVLDLIYSQTKSTFRLGAHPSYREGGFGWQAAWEKARHADRLAGEWEQVEDYLETVIRTIGPRFLKEGAVQSAISGFAHQDLIVIDREAVMAFSNQTEKDRVCAGLADPLLRAVAEGNGEKWWASRPTRLGGECDALAVDHEGQLLAIEVKPRNAIATISWSPLQVRHYTRVFEMWATGNANATEVIQGMVDQRVRLGLAPAFRPSIRQPMKVAPVIAIERGYDPKALDRLAEVQQRLIDAGLNDPPLRIADVSVTGRLRYLDPT